jgi:hypothetical protein
MTTHAYRGAKALRAVLAFCALLILAQSASAQPAGGQASAGGESLQARYLSRLEAVMTDYFDLMEEHAPKSSHYYRSYREFRVRLERGETSVRLSMETEDTVYGGAWFSIREDTGEYWLSVGKGLIDVYHLYPSLMYSVITHELWHARDYLADPENYVRHNQDKMEKLLYEKDAIFVEAMFIDEVLVPLEYELSYFETYLLRCHQADSISSFYITFQIVDSSVVDYIAHWRREYFAGESADTVYAALMDIGRRQLDSYSRLAGTDGEWDRYTALAGLNAWFIYSIHVIEQIEGRENRYDTWDDVFAGQPEYADLYDGIADIIDEQRDFMTGANESYRAAFDIAAAGGSE